MITLFTVTFSIELVFLAILRGIGWLELPFLFVAFFVVFFCVAVCVHPFIILQCVLMELVAKVVASLFIAKSLTNFLWSKDLDPDMYALPIHSASMDLIGQLLLVICFELVAGLGGGVRS
jgi:solute carrier family 41